MRKKQTLNSYTTIEKTIHYHVVISNAMTHGANVM